jgi:uncharacterized protein (TIGR03437 family)
VATPEFLYLKNNSDSVNLVAVHDSITYKWIGPVGLLPGVESAPAKAGDYLTIYGVGFRDTSPALVPGQTVNGTPRFAQPAQVSIGVARRTGCIRYTKNQCRVLSVC